MGKRVYSIPKAASSSDTRKNTKKKKFSKKNTDGLDIYEDVPALDDSVEATTDNYEIGSLVIDAEDDEEISEDDAFNAEDENRWGEFFASENPKSNASEDEEISENDSGSENVEISELISDSEEASAPDNLRNLIASLDNQYRDSHGAKKKRSQLEFVGESMSIPASSGLSLSALMGNDSRMEHLSKRLRKLDSTDNKIEAVSAPLPVRAQQRTDRQAAYESSSKDVSKWMPIVQKNRQADQLVFPMNVMPRQNATNASLASKFVATNDWEREIDKVLTDSHLISEKDVHLGEQLAMNKIDPEEIKRQRSELQKMRSLLFYQEKKEKRKSKIKSKKYHRILKKEREKKKAALESIHELDSEAAEAERLDLEKKRAEERMSLRHGKASKLTSRIFTSTESEETREAILEKLEIAEKLRKKIQGFDSDDSAVDDEIETKVDIPKPLESQEPEKPVKGLLAMKFMQKPVVSSNRDDFDVSDQESVNNTGRVRFGNSLPSLDNSGSTSASDKKTKKPLMIGNNFKGVERTSKPKEDSAQQDLIEMAFALDDVVEKEFHEEQEASLSKDVPEASTDLPGWGHWSGCGISERKKPVVESKKPTRRPQAMKNVIISDHRDKKFASKYLAPQVPFPYQNREQYEAMIRAPIGKEWNTTNVHKKLVKAKVVTKSGAIINPIKYTAQPKDKKKA